MFAITLNIGTFTGQRLPDSFQESMNFLLSEPNKEVLVPEINMVFKALETLSTRGSVKAINSKYK